MTSLTAEQGGICVLVPRPDLFKVKTELITSVISDNNITHFTRIAPQSSLALQQHLKRKQKFKRSVVAYLHNLHKTINLFRCHASSCYDSQIIPVLLCHAVCLKRLPDECSSNVSILKL